MNAVENYIEKNNVKSSSKIIEKIKGTRSSEKILLIMHKE